MISEIDINEWDKQDPTPLYSVRNKSFVQVEDQVFFFDHIDGMYSFCLDMNNSVVHLAAWIEVIPLKRKETE
jgi:hypothetical protein